MSDSSISIVPKLSNYPKAELKAKEILAWLVSRNIVVPSLSDCILSSGKNGYAVAKGAVEITDSPNFLPCDLVSNGLEITMERQIFDTRENGIDEFLCPTCKENIAQDDWDFNGWYELKSNDFKCPRCGNEAEIHNYTITPEMGFSNLGFTFWNWPELKTEFIQEFKEKLGCEIAVVFMHL